MQDPSDDNPKASMLLPEGGGIMRYGAHLQVLPDGRLQVWIAAGTEVAIAGTPELARRHILKLLADKPLDARQQQLADLVQETTDKIVTCGERLMQLNRN